MIKGTLKDLLKDKIPEELHPFLRRSFDIVGDIAIIEIPDELLPYKEVIANAILSKHKNVKVVLRKASGRSGEYRLEKLEHVAGEKRTVTTYKENGVLIKVDVEKTYFSPRLANERARINSLIEPYENVLVMFSGVGPYVINIAKNTKASKVVGIEINPFAHELALENAKINKVERKVEFYCGDVRNVSPELIRYVVGLKSSFDLEQVETRLRKDPRVYEFHSFSIEELQDKWVEIKKILDLFGERGIYFLIHMPQDLMQGDENIFQDSYVVKLKRWLNFLRKNVLPYSNFLGVVLHLEGIFSQKYEFDENTFSKIWKELQSFKVPLFIENTRALVFNKSLYFKLISCGVDKFVLDVAHFFREDKNFNFDKLKDLYNFLRDKATVFFHLSFGKFHEGEGLPLYHNPQFVENFFQKFVLDKVILEIHVKDVVNAKEMLESYDFVMEKKYFRKFDRIIMPLPKDAPLFLDVALKHVVPGSIIHIYNFVPEEKIEERGQELISKIKSYGYSSKILHIEKAGQYAPGIFRVCYDIQII